jgi:hypothetical protein
MGPTSRRASGPTETSWPSLGELRKWQVLEAGITVLWQNQTGRIHVRKRGSPERVPTGERYRRMIMAVNHKLTKVVKDRVVQNFQLNASILLINFVDGSKMTVTIVECNSPPLQAGARIRQISEDQTKLLFECEDESTLDVMMVNPGNSVIIRDKGDQVIRSSISDNNAARFSCFFVLLSAYVRKIQRSKFFFCYGGM